MRWSTSCFVLLMMVFGTPGAQQQAVQIELKNGNERERAAQRQLEGLLAKYDLTPWLFTRRVLISGGEIPHSHPVLTINTQYVDRDLHALAAFLHEQMHWRVDEERDPKAKAAIEEFRQVFPNAPDRAGGGARDTFSTYLHLIVCDLEYQVMTHLAGADQARAILNDNDHYRWIYDQVLNDSRIREVNQKYGFVISAPPR